MDLNPAYFHLCILKHCLENSINLINHSKNTKEIFFIKWQETWCIISLNFLCLRNDKKKQNPSFWFVNCNYCYLWTPYSTVAQENFLLSTLILCHSPTAGTTHQSHIMEYMLWKSAVVRSSHWCNKSHTSPVSLEMTSLPNSWCYLSCEDFLLFKP